MYFSEKIIGGIKMIMQEKTKILDKKIEEDSKGKKVGEEAEVEEEEEIALGEIDKKIMIEKLLERGKND